MKILSNSFSFNFGKRLAFALTFCIGSQACAQDARQNEIFDSTWWHVGAAQLEDRLSVVPNTNTAKNVILFIGDGMGVSTVTAARIFDGQSRGETGEENSLAFERFPNIALVKTYNTDFQVPDSAGTASAINTGVKTDRGVISVTEHHQFSDCRHSSLRYPEVVPKTIAEFAEQFGKSTGVITTARLTHATPAAVYSHSPNRDWEADSDIPDDLRESGCVDIARQLVDFEYGNGLDLILGGGRQEFLPVDLGGVRDHGDLTLDWLAASEDGVYIQTASELREQIDELPHQILGLFTPGFMSFEAERDPAKEPSLAEMTELAIEMLSRDNDGYFLMIEGGMVDQAHHANNAHYALSDTQALSMAVQFAVDNVDLSETLILVTADHSHGFSINGYPGRGNDILGLVRSNTDKA